ncbi:MAG: M28 family peptidase [Bacteroidota bacterium]|nr:M28 family peptidase [Bacteroidota bacterium]
MKYFLVLLFVTVSLFAQTERHFSNIKQITFGGSNAEAYFSADGKQLIYQATKDQYKCDQIFTMNIYGSNSKLVSTGEGRTTCAYFFPDGQKIVYASTHDNDDDCPPRADRSKGYTWEVYNAYDIYIANADGSNPKKLAASKGYDAEATISPDGKHIVFTSSRDGDLELYIMDADGKNVRRLTNDKGYDGGAFFSADGKKIVYRAHHPLDSAKIKEGEDLLKQELVKPSQMELFTINVDGSEKNQLTHNGAANFAPFFTPDGKKIIFASNVNDPKGYNFDLFLIDLHGKNIEQVTFNSGFDGFPMFSPDGKKLVFVSSRDAKSRHEFNIFLADWVPDSSVAYAKSHVDYLASNELEGRGTGEKGNELAAKYIADKFSELGLRPMGDNGTYFQEFEVVKSLELGKQNSLTAKLGKKTSNYSVQKDFVPISFSANASAEGNVIFAGYGMTVDSTYDDYAKIDAKNKVVIALRYSPDGDNPHSKYAKQSALRYKAMQAREKGAKALLLVTATADDSSDALVKLKFDNSFSDAGIPVFSVSRAIVNTWLKGNRITIDSLQKRIVRTNKQQSFELKNVTLSLSSEVIQLKKKTSNVLGLLKVNDNEEHLIIGGHFDHLGYGGIGSGSLAPDQNEIHNGADDNASGTSAMIETARELSYYKNILKRNVLFMGFSGEEMGVLGSAHYTKHPKLSLTQAVTMINYDMVGRLTDQTLTIQGTGTSSQWESLVTKYNSDSTFKLKFVKDGYGPSDHASFYGAGIPVLFFFTGLHDNYHRPSDDADKINSEGIAQIVSYASKLAVEIDTTAARPDYIKTQAPQQGTRQGFRVFVGTIPDYSEGADGMLLAGVRDNSPASKAGLLKGDVLIKFGKFEIKNVYDYTYALQEFKPGDEIEVKIVRNKTETITTKMTLEKRN